MILLYVRLFQIENDINYHVSSQMIFCATSAFDPKVT